MRLTPVFMLSATDVAHFPTEVKTFGAPEVAFLGRSNVGKSSLINSLLGSKQAHTSSTPGRTRAINFFALHEGSGDRMKPRPVMLFADLPGYGYAKISKSISSEWPAFIEPYLAERETLALPKSLKALREAHEVAEVLPVSAEKGTHIQELWKRLEAVAE